MSQKKINLGMTHIRSDGSHGLDSILYSRLATDNCAHMAALAVPDGMVNLQLLQAGGRQK